MANPIIGLLFIGLIVRTMIAVVVVVAVLWLVFKLSKVADAYTDKLRTSKKEN